MFGKRRDHYDSVVFKKMIKTVINKGIVTISCVINGQTVGVYNFAYDDIRSDLFDMNAAKFPLKELLKSHAIRGKKRTDAINKFVESINIVKSEK